MTCSGTKNRLNVSSPEQHINTDLDNFNNCVGRT